MTSDFDKIDALLVQIRSAYIHIDIRGAEPQLGQYYIAEYAKQNGFNVKVKSYSTNDTILDSLYTIVSRFSCDVIGFYVDSENVWHISRIAMFLRQSHPNLFIAIGGPQVTGDAELAMKRIPAANCGIIGEGERPFSELLSSLLNNEKDFKSVNGLIYRDNGSLHKTPSQLPINELDTYPYPRRYDLTLDENPIFDQISTGRGCVGRCTFCFEGNKTSNHLRLRSIESVIEEIDYIVSNLKVKNYISFLDDTFILSTERTSIICNHLINKYNGSIGWFCEGRVDILAKHLDMLPLIKKAGNIRIQLGGESGNQRILDAYKKQMKLGDLERVVKAIYENGIPSTYINFIIGGAFENIDTFKETLDYAKHLLNLAPGCAEVGCSLLTPYVGTPIRLNPAKYGIEIIDYDVITGPDGHIPVVKTESLSNKKIAQLKAIFESEIKEEYRKLIKNLSSDVIMRIYELKERFGMVTDWYVHANEVESNKNYFEPQIFYGFAPYHNIKDKKEFRVAIPYRTIQPVSDGERYFALKDGKELILLDGMREDVFLLCSGKLSYFQIEALLLQKYGSTDNTKSKIAEIFSEFDYNRWVIWKWMF